MLHIQVAAHFPEWIEEHGSLDVYSGQGMEHSNTETKLGMMKFTNRQRQRLTRRGKLTMSRVGQCMSRSLRLAQGRAKAKPVDSRQDRRAQPRRDAAKAAAIKASMAVKAEGMVRKHTARNAAFGNAEQQ